MASRVMLNHFVTETSKVPAMVLASVRIRHPTDTQAERVKIAWGNERMGKRALGADKMGEQGSTV